MTIASNLSLRITAILLAGFVALQLLIVAATTLPSRGDDQRPYNLPLPAQARAMVDALDRAPAGQRPALLDAFNGGLYTVSLAPVCPPPLPRRRPISSWCRFIMPARCPGGTSPWMAGDPGSAG